MISSLEKIDCDAVHQPVFLSHTPRPASSENIFQRFGLVPNFRTAPSIKDFRPLPPSEKFKIATQDTPDRGTFALAAISGGIDQLSNASPSFGQGAKGFGHYFMTSYADYAVGNYMTEAIYPTVLHQDPRYFCKGGSGGWVRLGYAVGQIVWTHGDSGRRQFNYSEILGNSTAVAISNGWYPDNHDASSAVSKLALQLGLDAMSNLTKEFWPEISRRLSRRGKASQTK